MGKLKNIFRKKWVLTTQEHSCIARTWPAGTEVHVYDMDPIRGFSLENRKGEHIDEIGWII